MLACRVIAIRVVAHCMNDSALRASLLAKLLAARFSAAPLDTAWKV